MISRLLQTFQASLLRFQTLLIGGSEVERVLAAQIYRGDLRPALQPRRGQELCDDLHVTSTGGHVERPLARLVRRSDLCAKHASSSPRGAPQSANDP